MKRLFLMGSIGCGKSTMIRSALGRDISQAGGFLTVRITDGPKLLGFELVSPRAFHQGHRFLDFENGTLQKDRVFTDFGISYLQTPASFAVIDEFGDFENIYYTDAGCTVSCHCGPGTLGVLFVRK